MEIIKLGELPEEKVYEAKCSNCGTQVRFQHKEGKVHYDQRDGNSIEVQCPLCSKPIYKAL